MKTLLILFFSLLFVFFTWQIYGLYSTSKTKEVGSEIIGIKNGLDNQMIIFDSIKINLRKIKLSFNPQCKNKC